MTLSTFDYAAVFDSIPIPATLIDSEGIILDINQAFLHYAHKCGRTIGKEDRIGHHIMDFVDTEEERTQFGAFIHEVLDTGEERHLPKLKSMDRSGRTFYVDIHAEVFKDEGGRLLGAILLREDVTEAVVQEQRKEAISRVREEVWRMKGSEDIEQILIAVRDGLEELGVSFRNCRVNVVDEATDPPSVWFYNMPKEGKCLIGEILEGVEVVRQVWREQVIVYRQDMDLEDIYGESGWIEGILKEHMRSVIDVPFSHGTLGVNSTELHAFSQEDIDLFQEMAQVLSEGFSRMEDFRVLEQRNQELKERERKYRQAVERGTHLNQLYSVLSKTNEAIIRIRNLQELYEQICRIAVEEGKFRMSWVGLVDPDTLLVKVVTYYGVNCGYLDKIQPSVEEILEGLGQIGTVIREGRYFICDNVEHDPRMLAWRDAAIKRGYRSSAAFPLRLGTHVIGVFNVYAGEPYFFDDEKVQLLKALVEDISFAIESIEKEEHRKQTEEVVRKWARIFKYAEWGVATSGQDGKSLEMMNPVFAKMHGYTEKELTGMPIINIYAPECRTEFLNQIGIAHKKGHHIFESKCIRKDGTFFPVLVDMTAVKDAKGKVLYHVVNVQDITERKRMESQLFRQSILVNGINRVLREGLTSESEVDLARACLSVAEELTGSKFGFIGEVNQAGRFDTIALSDPGWKDCRIPKSKQSVLLKNMEIRGIWGSVIRAEHSVIINDPDSHPDRVGVPDGHPLVTCFLGVPLKHLGKTIGLIGLGNKESGYDLADQQDIEALSIAFVEALMRRRGEKEKEEIQAQLLHAQKMEAIGILAGGVAHDFNNLLTTIQGYTDMTLMKLPKDSPMYQDLNQVRRASESAAGLTRQLLLFSRRQPMNLIPLNLNKTVSDLLNMLNRLVGEQFSITSDLGEGLWTINADVGCIEQVIMNLVVNARDVMPEGGEITIKTENVQIDAEYCKRYEYAHLGKFVCLSAKDRGIGMDSETMSRIFEPFFSTKGLGKGTGLGLSVVYGIVKQHEGWINVESLPGQGSTFSIYLPGVFKEAGGKREKIGSIEEYQGKGERVLVVEDEEAVKELIERMLGENGYVVLVASSVKEAFDVFTREGGLFHLVMSDVVLPDGSGIKLVEQLLSSEPGLRALFTSGYINETKERQIVQEKGYSFMQKPYVLLDLLRAIRELLN